MTRSLLAALLLVVALAGPASASPPASISVNDSDVHFGESVSWTLATNVQTFTVYVECSANETTLVNANVQSPLWGAYDNYNEGAFVIGESLSPYWIGGGADCVALLQKYNWNPNTGFKFTTLASTSFAVND